MAFRHFDILPKDLSRKLKCSAAFNWLSAVFIVALMSQMCNCIYINESVITMKHHQHQQPHRRVYRSKFTIEELLNTQFEYKTSNDIDMDPCKAGGFMGDIALPNVNYEADKEKQIPSLPNINFQQDLERLKQEVYNEGLQVEEEGMTDIIRKKTKLPNSNSENLNHRNRNDPTLSMNEPIKETSNNHHANGKIGRIPTQRETLISSHINNEHSGYGEKFSVDPITSPPSTTFSPTEKIEKPVINTNRNVDYRKIQSNTKDIVDDSGNNFVTTRKVIILPTSLPIPRSTLPNVFSNAGGNGGSLDDIEILQAEGSIRRRHRRRRQRRRSHLISDDEYNYKLERLKNELNRAVVTLEEMHNRYKFTLPSKSSLTTTPATSMHNKSSIRQNKRFNTTSEHYDAMDILTKRKSTIEAMESELDASLADLDADDLNEGMMKSLQHHHRVARAVTAKKERVWDYGVIPYEIDGNFSGAHKALFKQAMRHWENNTCIKFVERDPDMHPNYIIFTVRSCGCCSFVGKRGNGGQAISIGRNCDKFGIVVHELGHVVGFWHEHTRPDREKHVTIELSNIMKGQDYNFNMLTPDDVDSLGMPYDYDSIMHYARNTFSKGTYLDTILPIEVKGKKRPEIGQRIRLSVGDIAQANLLYKCPKCGQTFQSNSGSFTSPSYYIPGLINDTEKCEWRITATHGERITLKLENLNLLSTEKCLTDYLEVRDGYWHKSPLLGRFCGKVTEKTITTTSSRMLLTYVNMNRNAGYRGFKAEYEANCGGELTIDGEGRLESPNYPLEYLPGMECIWILSVPEGYQVALKFQSFEVENHDSCNYDYVEVRDGGSADETESPTIGIFCGYRNPPNMKSTKNKMYVKFSSDNSVQKAGFSAIFMKEVDECETQDHGCEHECINTLGGYECNCYIGYELHSDKKHCEDACGGVIEATEGTISSPSFPEYYPILKDCTWEIIAPPRNKISLNFTHFDLEGNNHQHIDCGYDYVRVFSKLGENRLKSIGTYCGSKIPPILTSEGNALRIEFHSDKSIQRTGFAALFFTDVDECATNNGGCHHDCRNTIGSYVCACHNGYTLHDNGHDCKEGECKYEITLPHGSIYSPNYPDMYPANLDCVWHFSTTPGHRIKLIFNEFEVESHQDCAYDHVVIYDGDSEESSTLGRFCGDKIPYPLSASSNEMYMVFKSDKNKQRRGFSAIHSTACGGYLRATSRIKHLYSHSKFGYQSYDQKMDCDWTIQADPGRNVQLIFLSFELEDIENCTYDYVEVYAGMEDTSGPLYGRYCGSNNPPDIISLTDSLLVRFRSDDTMSKKGFSASYVAVDPFDNIEEAGINCGNFSLVKWNCIYSKI
ncbi:unnamed protein product [Hermetia illucens]|uniref:Metalloendopeptidase n=1 Tax=Hermetia illucens TaxID=343691 RepID=A0A7R8YTI2_HERIL|nr:unnamed protein product [Hermetia illucens]